MELKYTRRERLAGLFVFFTVILFLITLVMIGRGKDWFKRHTPYFTTFEESYNLQQGADVKLLETKIGRVQEISLLQDRVKVKLVVQEAYAPRIRMGSVAKVRSPTLIGSEYVSITPGKRDAPLIPRGGLIPSEAKISLADVLKEFPVEKTFGLFLRTIQDLSEMAQRLRDPSGPLFGILNDVGRATGHIEVIARDMRAGKGTLGAVLRSEELLHIIREDLAKAGTILDRIAEASKKVPQNMDQIGSVLGHVEQATAQLPPTMDQVQQNLAVFKRAGEQAGERIAQLKVILTEIQKSAEAFKVILTNLEESSLDVPGITQSAQEGIREVRAGIENFNKVLNSIQKNFLIRRNLPPEPIGGATDAGLRK